MTFPKSEPLRHSATAGLLKIGIGYVETDGKGRSRPDAAEDLVQQAFAGIDHYLHPARLLILLATADWCDEPNATLPKDVRDASQQALGYEVPLVGGSMSSLFYFPGDIVAPERFIEQGLILVAVCSEHFQATVAATSGNPHLHGEAIRRKEIEALAKTMQDSAGRKLGASADSHVLVFTPGIYLDPNGAKVYQDNELHREIVAAFGHRRWVVGAAAANALEPTVGYQFADDRCLRSSLAIALTETDLATGTWMGHGLSPAPGIEVCVDRLEGDVAEGYVVAALDGKSAADRFAELKTPAACQQHRTLLGKANDDDLLIVCDLLDTARLPDGSVRLNRKVKRGDRLCLLQTSAAALEVNAMKVTRRACTTAKVKKRDVRLLFDFTCSGRDGLYQAHGLDWKDAAAALRKIVPGTPIIGGLAAGEFGMDSRLKAQANNLTFWVNCLADAFSPQAAMRDLQRKLMAAADLLRNCDSPQELMAAALQGATDAGATGGQICIVDHQTKRILGRDHGCSLSLQDCGDWSKAAEGTDRDFPEPDSGKSFPADLLELSMPANSLLKPDVVQSIRHDEDILTLITRTYRAVFVANADDSKFHNDPQLVAAGNIGPHLAIPLIGSNQRPLATLQLGLKYKHLDRESFGLWVGYSQKVAAALERAQEQEERELHQEISKATSRVLQQSSPSASSPRTKAGWCESYIEFIKDILNAQDVHVREMRIESGKDRYHLVGAVGELAELRKLAGEVTGPDDGSLDIRQIDEKNGEVANTREEIRQRVATFKAPRGKKKEFGRLLKKIKELESSAVFAIRHKGQVWGAITIDSRQRYYFTERRHRLAKAVAAGVANIVAWHERDAWEQEKKWLFDNLAVIKEPVTGSAARQLDCEELLKRICSVVKADVGSLFLWWDPPAKFILHAAHKWAHDMVGKAWYEKGDGWIGGVGNSDRSIVFHGCGEQEREFKTIRKYYQKMIPDTLRVARSVNDARIALVLRAGQKVLGVAAFFYYKDRQNILQDPGERQRIKEFFETISGHVTLAVETAKITLLNELHQDCMKSKEQVIKKLVEYPGTKLKIAPILATIWKAFSFERVGFWMPTSGNKFTYEEVAGSDGSTIVPAQTACPPIVRDVMEKGQPILLPAAIRKHLTHWPRYSADIESVFAIAVTDAEGRAKGVLAFINRKPSKGHPFNTPDPVEQTSLEDTARMFGAALDHKDREEDAAKQQEAAQKIEIWRRDLNASREREKQARAMSEAFQDVAHQIKSPLAEAGRQVDDAAKRYTQGAVVRDLHVIRSLLDRAELTAKLIGFFAILAKGERIVVKGAHVTPVDLVRLAGGICENQRHRLSESRNIQILLNADSFYKHTPANLTPDAELLRQAISNLVENAVKYSYPHSKIGVYAGVSKQGTFYIAVTNRGIPIRPDEKERVKQRGWRGEQAKLVTGEGGGLGLWIVDKIMAAQGYQLEVLPTRQNDGITEVRLVFSPKTEQK